MHKEHNLTHIDFHQNPHFFLTEPNDGTVFLKIILQLIQPVLLNVCQLVSSVDILCNQLGPRSGPTTCHTQCVKL